MANIFTRQRTIASYDPLSRADRIPKAKLDRQTSTTDYLLQFMPQAECECEGQNCIAVRPFAEMVQCDGKRYCSERCRDISNAPMIKPQPKGETVDGWDV